MSIVYDICLNFVLSVIGSILIVIVLKLLCAVFIKMSNTETQNIVTNDNNDSVFKKSKSIKDNTIPKDNKTIDINITEKKYEINGKIFNEKQFNENEKYLRFEIRDSKMASDDPNMSLDVTEETEASSSTPLSLGIQKVPNGVIINSNVYLSDSNYHTIVSLDGRRYCGVCDADCDIEYQDHINTEEHLENLKSHVPLCKYDLCIIRKLQEKYHCGVCNQIFDMTLSKEHFTSKYHEDKLLFGINRVSDIMYDLDINKNNKECYHFNAKNINNVNSNDSDSDVDFGGFYDASKLEADSESTDEISDVEIIPDPLSYASMAKKLQIAPKFIQIYVNGKKMDVRYDAWHMVLTLKSNKYYCMVCKNDGHVSTKIDHCRNDEHLSKLKKCTVVDKYVGFLIRKVDHRLYHCAHCNNLQLLIDIEDHINRRHEKKKIKNLTVKNKIITTENFKIKERSTDFSLERKELFIFCAKFNLSLLSYNMIISNYCCVCCTNSDDVKKHVIEVSHIENLNRCPFLFKFNCNLIRLIKNGYHCAICNVIVEYEIIDTHITEENHVKLLNNIITLSPNTQLIKDFTTSENDITSTNGTELKYPENIEESEVTKNKKDIIIEKDLDSNCEESFMNTEDLVYLKRKNLFAKVTLLSHNTLVPIGDGNKCCVLCSVNVDFGRLKQHIENRQHIENIRRYKYLEKYEKNLFRQILHTYHCSVCNVMFTYREINLHLSWPTHKHQLDKCHKIVTNSRKTDIKNGCKQIAVDWQKETLYTTYIEPKIKVGIYYVFSKNKEEIIKKSKIVINDGRVLKISWDSWNGFTKTKTGFKCCLCEKDIKAYEQTNHTKNRSHVQNVEENFLNEFKPALIRKINENKLNCVTCNVEVPYNLHILDDHVKGKKHEKLYELLARDSTECDNYTDCTDDIFTLQ